MQTYCVRYFTKIHLSGFKIRPPEKENSMCYIMYGVDMGNIW